MTFVPPRLIQAIAGPDAVGANVTAVQADAAGFASHGDDFFYGGMDVVGIHQQDRLLRKNVQKFGEGLLLILLRHDPGMRLRAVHRDAELLAGGDIRSALASADDRSARGQNPCFHSVATARAKFNYRAPRGSPDDAGGLAGNQGLKIDRRQQKGFHDLRFDGGPGHAQDGLAGEKYRALGHRPGLARKPEAREIVKKVAGHGAEDRKLSQILDILIRKIHVLQKVQGLIEARSHQIIPARRHVAHEEFKREPVLVPGRVVARGHGQFIQVGLQAGVLGGICRHLPGRHYAIRRSEGIGNVGTRAASRNFNAAGRVRQRFGRRQEYPAGKSPLRACATLRG